MSEETIRHQLAPMDIYRRLLAGKNLAVIRDELRMACTVGTLRHMVVDAARSDTFVNAILSDTPIELVAAVRRLLDSWFTCDTSEREQLRRLRRALVAIERLRTCFARALCD